MKRIITSIIVLIITLTVFALPVSAAGMNVSTSATIPDWSIEANSERELLTFRLLGLPNDPIPKSVLVKDTQGRDCIKLQLCDLITKKTKDVLLIYNSNGYNHGGYLVGIPKGTYEVKKIYGMETYFACQVFPVEETDSFNSVVVYYGSTNKNCQTANGNYIPCNTIAFTKRNFTLEVGNTVTVSPAFGPSDCTIKELTWVSSDERVASIKNNVITAHNAGRVALTCYHEDGVSQTITINVHPSSGGAIVERPNQPTEPEETTPPVTKPTEPETKPSEPTKPNEPEDTTPPTNPSTPSTPKEDDETKPPETTVNPPSNGETVDPDTSSSDEEKPVTSPSDDPETDKDEQVEDEEPKDNTRLKKILGAVVSFLILVVMGMAGWLVYKKFFYDKY